jgi:hypothetical protein
MAFFCAQGVFARMFSKDGAGQLAFTSGHTTEEFVRENLAKRGTIAHPNGIRGTRSAPSERARTGPYAPFGTIHFNPDPGFLGRWLQRAMGGTPTGADPITYPLAEGLSPFGVAIDRVTTKFRYNDCYINQFQLSGRRTEYGAHPDVLDVMMEVYAQTRDKGITVTDTPLAFTADAAPYIFEDATITMLGVTREMFNVVLRIHNHLHVRTSNSLTPTIICPTNRSVTFEATVPYTANETDLLDQTTAGAAAVLKFTNGNMSIEWDLATLQVESHDPVVTGKGEIVLPIRGIARTVGAVKELVAINDSTP